jgi:hypothetical protein
MKSLINFESVLKASALVCLIAGGAANAATMTRTEARAEKTQINAQYKTAKAACAPSTGNAKTRSAHSAATVDANKI